MSKTNKPAIDLALKTIELWATRFGYDNAWDKEDCASGGPIQALAQQAFHLLTNTNLGNDDGIIAACRLIAEAYLWDGWVWANCGEGALSSDGTKGLNFCADWPEPQDPAELTADDIEVQDEEYTEAELSRDSYRADSGRESFCSD